jgi:pyruvate formate lyase activating enzyme
MIKGLQKTTVLDYPGKIACTIFLYGCNFRCGFCHNPELVLKPTEEKYSEDYVLDFLKKRIGKLEGVCFTGGEPLMSLRKEFVREIKNLGYDIKVDTNGSNPDKLKNLIEENLVDYISMDLKSSPVNYSKVVNSKVEIEKIEETIRLMVSYGGDYEFRTTIVNRFHDVNEIKNIGEWIKGLVDKKPKKYFLQGFVNKGKLIDDDFKNEKNVYEEDMVEMKIIAEEYFEEVGVRV